MSQNLQSFTRAVHQLRSVATRVPADAWNNQSCCEEWTARQVAGHASWVLQNIAATASDTAGPAEQPEADVAGDDPGATLRMSIDGVLAALDQQGVLSKTAQTPFGAMPIDSFLGAIWVDPMTHAWDIADATGIDHGIDEASAEQALESLSAISDAIRGPGLFAAPVSTDGNAVDRFVAFAGRTPVRR